jgi:hypothetical protein
MRDIKIDDDLLFAKLPNIKIDKNSSIKSLIKNISCYCYDTIELDRAFSIENWLEKLLECEVYLSFTKKRHRDHLLHACRIAILGDIILNSKIDNSKSNFILLDLIRELFRQNSTLIQMFNKYDLNIVNMDDAELNTLVFG